MVLCVPPRCSGISEPRNGCWAITTALQRLWGNRSTLRPDSRAIRFAWHAFNPTRFGTTRPPTVCGWDALT